MKNRKKKGVALHQMLLSFSRFLYVIGIQSIRLGKRFCRRLVRFLRPLFKSLYRVYDTTFGRVFRKIAEEYFSLCHGFSIARNRIQKANKKGFFKTVAAAFSALGRGITRHKNIAGVLLNIVAPIAAILFLFHTIQYWQGLEYGLTLSCGNQSIATIRNEEVFDEAMKMMTERMVHDTEGSTLHLSPAFQLRILKNEECTEAAEICDMMIRQSSEFIEEATGLYIDGKLVGALRSSADLNHILTTILDEAIGEETDCEVSFLQKVEMVTGLFPTNAVITTDEMREYLYVHDTEKVVYIVQSGDTPSGIAQANGLTVEELDALNDGDVRAKMYPGKEIVLQIGVPRLGVKISKKVTYEEEIPYKTVTQKDNSQYTDYSSVVQDGQNGTQRKTDKVTYANGVEIGRENIDNVIIEKPVDKIIVTGTKKRSTEPGESSGRFIWPTPSLGIITTYYEYRWGSFHSALDISGYNAYGSSIVASDGGTVAAAGWGNGYGWRVIIDHGNGYRTLYAHCSELLVSAGDKVSSGQLIARVGSTGNSTGPHLHFEIIKDGSKVNPLNYVSPY